MTSRRLSASRAGSARSGRRERDHSAPWPDSTLRSRGSGRTPRPSTRRARALAADATVPVAGGLAWAFDPLHRTRSPAGTSVEAYRAFLARIRCPVLLVEGGLSGFRTWVADDREHSLADLSHHLLPDAGHMLHHEAPDALAVAVAAFLRAAP